MGSKVTDQNVAWINLVLRKFYVGTLSTVSKCFSMNRRAEKQIFKLQGTSQALWTKLCSMKWQLQSQLMLHRVLCGCILCITKDNFQSHEQCSSVSSHKSWKESQLKFFASFQRVWQPLWKPEGIECHWTFVVSVAVRFSEQLQWQRSSSKSAYWLQVIT